MGCHSSNTTTACKEWLEWLPFICYVTLIESDTASKHPRFVVGFVCLFLSSEGWPCWMSCWGDVSRGQTQVTEQPETCECLEWRNESALSFRAVPRVSTVPCADTLSVELCGVKRILKRRVTRKHRYSQQEAIKYPVTTAIHQSLQNYLKISTTYFLFLWHSS